MENISYENDELNELDDVLDNSYFASDNDEIKERKSSSILADEYFRRISEL